MACLRRRGSAAKCSDRSRFQKPLGSGKSEVRSWISSGEATDYGAHIQRPYSVLLSLPYNLIIDWCNDHFACVFPDDGQPMVSLGHDTSILCFPHLLLPYVCPSGCSPHTGTHWPCGTRSFCPPFRKRFRFGAFSCMRPHTTPQSPAPAHLFPFPRSWVKQRIPVGLPQRRKSSDGADAPSTHACGMIPSHTPVNKGHPTPADACLSHWQLMQPK